MKNAQQLGKGNTADNGRQSHPPPRVSVSVSFLSTSTHATKARQSAASRQETRQPGNGQGEQGADRAHA